MYSLQKLRKNIFWGLDFLKGKPVKKHLEEIETIIEENNSEKAKELRSKYLSNLLHHATTQTKFYSSYKDKEFEEFPVINKMTIKQNFDNFVSQKLHKSELFELTTSGSTGTPFTIYQNKSKRARNTADTSFFAGKAGYQFGQKLYYLKIWSDANRKSPLKAWMQNVEQIDVVSLDDNKIQLLLDRFKSEKTDFGIIGYSSALEQLCAYLRKNSSVRIETKIKSIISMSETLNLETQKDLKRFFGINAFSRYSNTENGILSQQFDSSTNEFLVNDASYKLEIFDLDQDIPIADGKLGRIIITDLHNYALPMIRYDSGDLGVIQRCSLDRMSNPVLTQIEGRKLDQLYDTKGQLVSSLLMYKNMWKYKEITQYQLVQKTANKYVIKLNHDGSFQREDELISEWISYFGVDANVEVEYVDEIPLLSSGKRKKVVNEFYGS